MIKKYILPAILIFSLVACNQSSVPQVNAIRNELNDALSEYAQCSNRIKSDRKFDRIYRKISIAALTATDDQLNDKEKITNEDKAMLVEWWSQKSPCDIEMINKLAKIEPSSIVIWLQIQDFAAKAIERIMASDKITYADANIAMEQHRANMKKQGALIGEKIKRKIQIATENYNRQIAAEKNRQSAVQAQQQADFAETADTALQILSLVINVASALSGTHVRINHHMVRMYAVSHVQERPVQLPRYKCYAEHLTVKCRTEAF